MEDDSRLHTRYFVSERAVWCRIAGTLMCEATLNWQLRWLVEKNNGQFGRVQHRPRLVGRA